MVKLANISSEEITVMFDAGEIVMLPESVIELPANRIKKLSSVKNHATSCEEIGVDSDAIIDQEHTFETSQSIIMRLRAGKSFRGMVKLGDLLIMPKSIKESLKIGADVPDSGNSMDVNKIKQGVDELDDLPHLEYVDGTIVSDFDSDICNLDDNHSDDDEVIIRRP